MLTLEEACERIMAALPLPVAESIPLATALGPVARVLAQEVAAPINLPPFDNSAMDGYAVRANDVAGAGLELPVALRVVGRVAAGGHFPGTLQAGECVRLFTGSPLPAGADAVVMQEDTRTEAAWPERVWIHDAVQPGESVRRCGDDVQVGTILGRTGERLTPGRGALLAATGLTHVTVGRQPIVGLLATGSELRTGGEPLGPGQIYESNRAALAALVAGAGGRPRLFPLVPDTLEATQAALETALAETDLVITSGGVSVGEMDFVKAAWERLGGRMAFWKVAIRPGKPFVFGQCGPKFLFGLPGNPVSAFVTFLLLVRPALLRWQGAQDIGLPVARGILGEALANPGDRRHFVRVRLDVAGQVWSAGKQASHALGSLAEANGLVDLGPGEMLPVGIAVNVHRWE